MFIIQLGHPKINTIISTHFDSVKDVFPCLFHKNEESFFAFWNEIPIQFQYSGLFQNFDEILAMTWFLEKEAEGKTKAVFINEILKISFHLYWKEDNLRVQGIFDAVDDRHQSYADTLNEKSELNFSKDFFLNEWNTLLHQIITAFDTANIFVADGTERRKLELLHKVEKSITGYGKLYIR